VKKENIKVHIIGENILEICGQRSNDEVHDRDKWHLVERVSGSFLCRICLPPNANSNDVKAHVEYGVLSVTIAKYTKPEPHVQKIVVS